MRLKVYLCYVLCSVMETQGNWNGDKATFYAMAWLSAAGNTHPGDTCYGRKEGRGGKICQVPQSRRYSVQMQMQKNGGSQTFVEGPVSPEMALVPTALGSRFKRSRRKGSTGCITPHHETPGHGLDPGGKWPLEKGNSERPRNCLWVKKDRFPSVRSPPSVTRTVEATNKSQL